jgi:hypothetical protein
LAERIRLPARRGRHCSWATLPAAAASGREAPRPICIIAVYAARAYYSQPSIAGTSEFAFKNAGSRTTGSLQQPFECSSWCKRHVIATSRLRRSNPCGARCTMSCFAALAMTELGEAAEHSIARCGAEARWTGND